MLWHIVRFTFADDMSETHRDELEDQLRSLVDHIDELRFIRVARDLDDPSVTGLISGFDDADGLAVYADHPAHVPVAARLREASKDIARLDVVTDDPPDALA